MKKQLIFVYNADSGFFNSLTDFAHKLISPSTYSCKLCLLTYENISMKQEWKSYLENFPARVIFLHKDEFIRQYHLQGEFPAVFMQEKKQVELFISKEEIGHCQSFEQLKELIYAKFKSYDQHHYSGI